MDECELNHTSQQPLL